MSMSHLAATRMSVTRTERRELTDGQPSAQALRRFSQHERFGSVCDAEVATGFERGDERILTGWENALRPSHKRSLARRRQQAAWPWFGANRPHATSTPRGCLTARSRAA